MQGDSAIPRHRCSRCAAVALGHHRRIRKVAAKRCGSSRACAMTKSECYSEVWGGTQSNFLPCAIIIAAQGSHDARGGRGIANLDCTVSDICRADSLGAAGISARRSAHSRPCAAPMHDCKGRLSGKFVARAHWIERLPGRRRLTSHAIRMADVRRTRPFDG